MTHFFVLSLLLVLPVSSHYQWITIDRTASSVPNREFFRIGCGHKFPESELLLKREIVSSVDLLSNGIKTGIEISGRGKEWIGEIDLKGNGEYIIVFSLKKKISKAPFFWGRMVIFSEKSAGPHVKLATGAGLEIIPKDLFTKKKTDDLRIRVFLDGESVRSTLTIIPEGKKPVYLNPGKNNYCLLKLKYSGPYMLYTFYKGKGASLTFFLK